MLQKFSRVPGGPAFKLVILGLAILGLGLAGCSEDLPTQPVDNTDAVTGVFHVDKIDDTVDFEFISTNNGDPADPVYGPFAIRGHNIRYDTANGLLIVDLSVENLGEETYDEGVTLTFLSLLPDGVTVLNSDNSESGNGAAINFEFDNDDGQWTPGEVSFLRETRFGVAEGVAIGFVARLDTGTGRGLGSIGGMVWNDENGDGIMDGTESGIDGAALELSAEGMDVLTTLSAADGTYRFDDLAAGFYRVSKMAQDGMVPTTPGSIYVILVAEDGSVTSFLAANFGCQADSTGGATAYIKGIVFNDLNGDGKRNDGEPGLEGLPVMLAGDTSDSTMTMADGGFIFSDLAAGSYQVTSTGPQNWVATNGESMTVILDADDQAFSDGLFGWSEEVPSLVIR